MSYSFATPLELITPQTPPLPDLFFARLIAFYERVKPLACAISPIWQDIFNNVHAQLDVALLAPYPDRVRRMLEDGYYTHLPYGFDYGQPGSNGGALSDYQARWTCACLSAACGVGILPVFNPEQAVPRAINLPDLFRAFERELQTSLHHPGGGGLFGVKVDGRMVPMKLLDGLCVLLEPWRQLPRLPLTFLELGAGSGMLGFLASKIFRLEGYHTVDLPIASVFQAFMLAQVFEPSRIWLFGEPANPAAFVHIHGPQWPEGFLPQLIVNQDSLPEMTAERQSFYADKIAACLSGSGLFVSVNHESDQAGQARVFGLFNSVLSLKLQSRTPFWGRAGYVLELWKHRL